MRKDGTGRPDGWRGVGRRTAALFLVGLAAWLIWFTTDHREVAETLGGVLDKENTAGAATEQDPQDGLSALDKVVVNQSPILSGMGGEAAQQPSEEAAPSDDPESSVSIKSPRPTEGEQPSDEPQPTPSSQPEETPPPEDTPPPEETPVPEEIPGVVLPIAGRVGDFISTRGISYYSAEGQKVNLATLNLPAPVFEGDGPQILIVHTHLTEAFSPANSGETYVECGELRTMDNYYNMYRIGEEVARVLREQGWNVIHDDTPHDNPKYAGAYTRSCETVEEWLELYPSIQIVLDLHRDSATTKSGELYRPVAVVDGKEVAQVMLVVGSEAGEQYNPNWRDNLGLAVAVQNGLNTDYPGLARNVILKASRYNQHLTTGSLLVEMGYSGNTISEVLDAARYFALSLSGTLEYLSTLNQ